MINIPSKKTILITAGPTVEPIDPVRFLSNRSTGEMGFALAKAAKRRGYKVVLVSGPTYLTPPKGVKFVRVKRALCMKREAFRFFSRAGCVIMAAAVSDFRPAAVSKTKIKKSSRGALCLRLAKNPDILASMGRKKGRRLLVGFSLETDRPIAHAREKLKSKNLDMIVVNKAGKGLDPFGPGAKDVVVIDRSGRIKPVKSAPKSRIAGLILDHIETL